MDKLQGLEEALALYTASVKKSPALMMETVNVDSNRGVTSRGNSPYDKFASPATRAKVLESRMQEITAFAQSRSLPAAALYALAEAAMRTGKIPDLGQYGLAGDDAVATKQFMLSNVLNIAGLEWTDYKGDAIEEIANPEREAERNEIAARQKKLAARRSAARNTGGFQESDLAATNPLRYMAEANLDEGSSTLRKLKAGGDITGKPSGVAVGGDYPAVSRTQKGWEHMKRRTKRARDHALDPASRAETSEQMKIADYRRRSTPASSRTPEGLIPKDKTKGSTRSSPAGRRNVKQWDREDKEREMRAALDKKRAARKTQQDDVSIDPSRFMAENTSGNVGGPESAVSSPSNTSLGGEPKDLQNYERTDFLPKKIMAALKKNCGDGVYGYTRAELLRLAREQGLLGTEEDVALEANGIVSRVSGSGAGSEFAPTKPNQYDVEDEILDGAKKAVKEDRRSQTDRILGIMDGDPRGDAWPKLGGEMARLMNLEDCGVFRGPRGFSMDEPAIEPIQEMTVSAGMGGFIGGGMVGGMTGRTVAMPSYDDSYELPEDPDKRLEMLKKLLDKHGLKKPVDGQ